MAWLFTEVFNFSSRSSITEECDVFRLFAAGKEDFAAGIVNTGTKPDESLKSMGTNGTPKKLFEGRDNS